MTIKYKNITIEKYLKLSDKEKKENAYCIKYSNGDMEWRVNGLFHREDGPALDYSDGKVFWWLDGCPILFDVWCNKLNKTNEEKVFLRLKYED